MKSIEGRVNSSKQELNIAEVGCKKRYKKQITELGEDNASFN